MSVKISSLNTASTINSGDDITIAGNNPLYFSDWGGGWYMQDGTWMRNYDRSLWIGTGVYGTDGGLTIGYGGGAPPSAGAIIAGNVGIGTATPDSKLHISTTTSNPFRMVRTGGTATNFGFEFGSGDIGFYNYSSSTYGWYLTSAGNVGIGTASPSYKLHVVDSSNEIVAKFSGANDTTIIIGGSDLGSGEKYITYQNNTTGTDAWMVGMDDDETFRFAYGAAGEITDANAKMIILQSGNVGIGTTTPGFKLEINGYIRYGGSSAYSTTGLDSAGFYQDVTGTTAVQNTMRLQSNSVSGISSYNGIKFGGAALNNASEGFTIYTGGYDNNRLSINSSGNVGIGTASPSQKLDVSGNIFASGYVQGGSAYISDQSGVSSFGSNSGTRSIRIGRDGTANDIFIAGSSGNVLIGTTTDSGSKLYVDGTGNFSAGLIATKTAKNTYGIQIKGGFYGAPRLQLYDLAVDGNAFLGLGTDMSGGAYEFSNYFPRYAGYGRWSVGSWAGAFGTGQYVSGYNEKLWINESSAAFNVPLNVVGALTQSGNQVLHAGNYNSYAPTLTGTGASGTWGISVTGSAATAGTSTYASILTTTNQGIVGSTGLTTVSSEAQWSNFPIGYSAMFLSNQVATGAPSATYGFFIKIANRDAAGGWGGIWTDYSGGDTYVGNTTVGTSYANWYKLLSSNNYGSYALPLTGGNLTGLVISTANIEATAFRTDGNFELTSGLTGLKSNFYDTRFYASSTSYWNITSSAAATTGALLFRQGYESTVKGYVYWDSAGFGLLNNVGNWAVRTNYGGSMGGSLYGSWVVRSMTVDLGLLSFYTSAGVTKGSVAWDDQGFGLHNNQNDYSLICNQGSSFGGLLIGTWSSTGDFNIAGANLSINSNASYINANITYSSSSAPYGEHWYSGMDYDSTADESYYYIYYADGNQFRIYPDGTIYVNGGAFSQYSAVGNYISVGAYGLYSNTYSAYFRRNDSSSYAPWELVGAKGGYTGISYSTSNQPHIMFNTSNGNGGLYYQTGSRWVLYYDYSNNSLGVGGTTTDSTYKLYVNGNVRVVGTFNLSTLITNGAVYSIGGGLTNTNPSDIRLKENIAPLQYGLKEVMALNPVTYKWKDGSNGGQRSTGLIAQDVQEVMPEYVKNISEDSDFLGLDSYAINIVLINAIKELQAKIEILENK